MSETHRIVNMVIMFTEEVYKALNEMEARVCGHEIRISGAGKPKMTWEVKCSKIKGHLPPHSDGATNWEE